MADVTPALRSVNWALASRDAHLFGIKSISLGECGFPAAQRRFQSSLIVVSAQSISVRAEEPPQPHLHALAARGGGGGRRGLGGRRGASDGGCWAGVGAEWRAEAPQLPSASPSLAWQPRSTGSMN